MRSSLASSSRFQTQSSASSGASTSSDSPLFERQVGNDEYSALQQCRTLTEQLHGRIHRLEEINLDLEHRLEAQAKETMGIETECINIQRATRAKCEALEKDIQRWQALFETEQNKSAKLREQLSRTEKELYGILQRKYELMRGGPQGAASAAMRGRAPPEAAPKNNSSAGAETAATNSAVTNNTAKSAPRESQLVREKRALANLSDFLGL